MANKKKTDAPAQQIPVTFSNNPASSSYANVFQTRILDSGVLLSYGISHPAQAAGPEGKAQPVLSVEFERRVMMTLDSAKNLAAALTKTVNDFEAQRVAAANAAAAPADKPEGEEQK